MERNEKRYKTLYHLEIYYTDSDDNNVHLGKDVTLDDEILLKELFARNYKMGLIKSYTVVLTTYTQYEYELVPVRRKKETHVYKGSDKVWQSKD